MSELTLEELEEYLETQRLKLNKDIRDNPKMSEQDRRSRLDYANCISGIQLYIKLRRRDQ